MRALLLGPLSILLLLGTSSVTVAEERTYVWGGIQYPEGYRSIPQRRSRLPVYIEIKRQPAQPRSTQVLVIRLERPIVIEKTRSSYRRARDQGPSPRVSARWADRGRARASGWSRTTPGAGTRPRAQRGGGVVSGGVVVGGRGGSAVRGASSGSRFPRSRFDIYGSRGRSKIYPGGRSRIYPGGRR